KFLRADFLPVFIENILNTRLLLRLHFKGNVVTDLISAEVDERQVPNRIVADEQAYGSNNCHHDSSCFMRKNIFEAAPVPEQMQHKDHQDHVLDKRLPGCEFYRIAKAPAVGYL